MAKPFKLKLLLFVPYLAHVTLSQEYPASTPSSTNPPSFPLNVGNWSVKDDKRTCIMFTGAIMLQHIKNETNTLDRVLNTVHVPNSPKNVNVTGKCGSKEQELVLKWWSNNCIDQNSKRNNMLTLIFTKHPRGPHFLSSVTYHYTDEVHLSMECKDSFFQAKFEHSLRCQLNQQAQQSDTNGDGPYKIYILTENLQFEPSGPMRKENDARPEITIPDNCQPYDEDQEDHKLNTGVLIGMSVGVTLSGIAGVVIGVYLCKRYLQGIKHPVQ